MRTKVEIQREWLAWFNDYAADQSITGDAKATLKTALAQEIGWMVGVVADFESHLQSRLNKIDRLLDATEGDMSAFDPHWAHRKALLEWMQT